MLREKNRSLNLKIVHWPESSDRISSKSDLVYFNSFVAYSCYLSSNDTHIATIIFPLVRGKYLYDDATFCTQKCTLISKIGRVAHQWVFWGNSALMSLKPRAMRTCYFKFKVWSLSIRGLNFMIALEGVGGGQTWWQQPRMWLIWGFSWNSRWSPYDTDHDIQKNRVT